MTTTEHVIVRAWRPATPWVTVAPHTPELPDELHAAPLADSATLCNREVASGTTAGLWPPSTRAPRVCDRCAELAA
ncbi:hypothetical protein [Modestobacter sp. I12A-02662]|uniref:hypothetical protein n=1 Tax=Modestobacter sp. I12A-02662 TaxID=1730496 RepID=UPI0034DFB0A4